jgi:hypothetical protein
MRNTSTRCGIVSTSRRKRICKRSARRDVETIPQRVLVFRIRQLNVGAPLVGDGPGHKRHALIVVEAPDQQAAAFVGIASAALIMYRHKRCFG